MDRLANVSAKSRPRTAALLGMACVFVIEAAGLVPPAPVLALEKQPPPTFKAMPTASRIVLIQTDPNDAEARPTVFLQAAEEPEEPGPGRSPHLGMLAREIPRQALLIAARDGLGLETRDATLGDSAGAAKGEVIADLVTCIVEEDSARLTIRRGAADAAEPDFLFAEDWPLPIRELLDYPKLVERTESFSRGPFVEILKKAGCTGKAITARAEATAPKGVEDRLERMDFVDQFAALRQLHDEIRTRGESPELLGMLARGYAQLGVLTESHWDATSHVYKARALLYAQRLVARNPKAPLGLWYRAFARALVGLHAAALSDLAAADALAKADKPGAARPDWADAIDAVCRFQTAALNVPDADRHAQLAALLRFLTVEHSVSNGTILDAAQDGVRRNPECFRLYDALCEYGGVSVQHVATEDGPNTLTLALPTRLGETPGLPARVAAILPDWDEVAATRRLAEAGVPERDAGEPSWAALAHLIREARFAMAWRRLRFMRDIWSVPVDDALAEIRPLVIDHPYRNFLEIYAFDSNRDKQPIAMLLKDVKPRDHTLAQLTLVYEMQLVDHARASKLGWPMQGHRDALPHDLEAGFSDPKAHVDPQIAHWLLKISPHSPAAMSCLIRDDWEFAKGRVDAWEKELGQHPLVLGTLARHFDARKQTDDAVRCYQKYIKLSPDRWAYERLAAIYLERGEPEKWRAALDEFLTKPDSGLEHQVVQIAIASRLIGEKKWQEALPYARDAAETWAGGGIACAVHCYEGLKDWENAELWVRRLVERYPSFYWDDWFFWCLRTGHGDREAARDAATAWVQQNGPARTVQDLNRFAYFFWATGQTEKALVAFRDLQKQTKDGGIRMPMTVLADETGAVAERDATLEQILKDKDSAPHLVEFLGLFRAWFAKDKGTKFDLAALDAVIAKFTPPGQGTTNFLAGRFLAAHDRPDDAAKYLERCARNRQTYGYMRILAVDAMRARGVELEDLPEEKGERP